MSYAEKQMFKQRIFQHILELDANSLTDLLQEPIPYKSLNDVRYSAPVNAFHDCGSSFMCGQKPFLYRRGTHRHVWGAHWEKLDDEIWNKWSQEDRYPHLLMHYDGLNPFEMLMRLWNVCHRPPNSGEIAYLPNGCEIFDVQSTNSRLTDLHEVQEDVYTLSVRETTYGRRVLPMMNILYVHMNATSLRGDGQYGTRARWRGLFYDYSDGMINWPENNDVVSRKRYFPEKLTLLKWAVHFANPAVIKTVLRFRTLTMDSISVAVGYNRYYERENSVQPVYYCDRYDDLEKEEQVNFDFTKSVAHLVLQKCTKEVVNTYTRFGSTVWSILWWADGFDVVNRQSEYTQELEALLKIGADPTITDLKMTAERNDFIQRNRTEAYRKSLSGWTPKSGYDMALACVDEKTSPVKLAKYLWKRRLVALDPARWPTINAFDDVSVVELSAMYDGHPKNMREQLESFESDVSEQPRKKAKTASDYTKSIP